MPKKTFAEQLRELQRTIEYRSIKARLRKFANEDKSQFLIIQLKPLTVELLQADGLTVETIEEFGFKKYKITWDQ